MKDLQFCVHVVAKALNLEISRCNYSSHGLEWLISIETKRMLHSIAIMKAAYTLLVSNW